MADIVQGKIWEGSYGENDDVLKVGYNSDPLSMRLEHLQGKQVSIKFWISDDEAGIEEVKKDAILSIIGSCEVEYNSRYSEITGYLWTDEELKVGNHDILEMIREHVGKFLLLQVEIH